MKKEHDWFKKAGFGLMLHFGLYSVLGGEWKGKRMGNTIGEWIQSYFKIPNSEYHKLAEVFNPIFFDAEEWVKLAKEAGMKYFVITAKHHDGFSLFKSDVSDFSSVDASPCKRDIIAECSKACRKHGIKFGLYYSQALDWSHPDGGGFTAPELNVENMSWTNNWDFPNENRKVYSRCYEEKIKPQVIELLTNYGEISLVWFDTPYDITEEQATELYNLVKKYQPNCLVNSRISGEIEPDYYSAGDNEIPDDAKTVLYESPATLNDTWGYKTYDENWKDANAVLKTKRHLNALGINYLLNIGPDYLGRMPAPAMEVLKQLAKLKGL